MSSNINVHREKKSTRGFYKTSFELFVDKRPDGAQGYVEKIWGPWYLQNLTVLPEI